MRDPRESAPDGCVRVRALLARFPPEPVRPVIQGLSLVFVGSVVGLLLAAAATRLFTRLLFGMPPLDPLVFAGAALLFAGMGLAACFVPARRATQIDAMEALRFE